MHSRPPCLFIIPTNGSGMSESSQFGLDKSYLLGLTRYTDEIGLGYFVFRLVHEFNSKRAKQNSGEALNDRKLRELIARVRDETTNIKSLSDLEQHCIGPNLAKLCKIVKEDHDAEILSALTLATSTKQRLVTSIKRELESTELLDDEKLFQLNLRGFAEDYNQHLAWTPCCPKIQHLPDIPDSKYP